ncbi:MAG: aminotransferase class IV [Thermodesulfobacteriota bacterium]
MSRKIELEQVFINGKRTQPEVPLRAVFYGEGVFETFRFKSGMPVFFEKHYSRMEHGAGVLGIPHIGIGDLADLIKQAVSETRLSDAYVKVCLLSEGSSAYYDYPTKGDILVIVREYAPREEPVKISNSSFKRSSESPVYRIKSLNYLENVIARREANQKGFDESLFVNENEEIAECTSSNIFWIGNDTLYTPSIDCGILPGITREILINSVSELGITVEEGRFSPEDIAGCEFAFLTNSLSGSFIISQLGGLNLPVKNHLYESVKELLHEKLEWY